MGFCERCAIAESRLAIDDGRRRRRAIAAKSFCRVNTRYLAVLLYSVCIYGWGKPCARPDYVIGLRVFGQRYKH